MRQTLCGRWKAVFDTEAAVTNFARRSRKPAYGVGANNRSSVVVLAPRLFGTSTAPAAKSGGERRAVSFRESRRARTSARRAPATVQAQSGRAHGFGVQDATLERSARRGNVTSVPKTHVFSELHVISTRSPASAPSRLRDGRFGARRVSNIRYIGAMPRRGGNRDLHGRKHGKHDSSSARQLSGTRSKSAKLARPAGRESAEDHKLCVRDGTALASARGALTSSHARWRCLALPTDSFSSRKLTFTASARRGNVLSRSETQRLGNSTAAR